MLELDPEDAKLVTLARGARMRAHVPYSGGAEGAAVRDAEGRTYAAGAGALVATGSMTGVATSRTSGGLVVAAGRATGAGPPDGGISGAAAFAGRPASEAGGETGVAGRAAGVGAVASDRAAADGS